ncbi:hypothetical protein F8M41_009220 [Gigaspora margarita]|uniref:Uncharacterized protein n=1 Tax=Gigaspora margarita TaxID=4874 RepID=A0A8H4A1T4_GIGMA|nr:hypothetical protein F8M41_009220 [Gigaspora margarita]
MSEPTIIKGDPIYRAYIFSLTNSDDKYQWKCINIIKLTNFYKSFILPKGKFLFLTEIPFVITQWNLESLKFEAQYVLDLNMFEDKYYIDVQLNVDNTLLVVFNRKQDAINVYSTSQVLCYQNKIIHLRLDDTLSSHDTLKKYLYPNVIIFDFILGVWDNKVWIRTLVEETREWIDICF